MKLFGLFKRDPAKKERNALDKRVRYARKMVSSVQRTIVCSNCGHGGEKVGGQTKNLPTYLVTVEHGYRHGDMRACAHFIALEAVKGKRDNIKKALTGLSGG